ncbi:MAG: hypothetical protein QM730_24110 [Anaerolineales bacterium]
MAIPKKVIAGKVQKNSSKNFKIQKQKDTERDVDIDIEEDGTYEVEKLSVDDLPTKMEDGTDILWFNNFSIKKNGQYINQSFKVTIAGLSAVRAEKKNIVIWDGNSNNGKPWIFSGDVIDDTIELTDGDPSVGQNPPR